VEGVLDIHARGVKIIKKILYLDVVTMHLLYIKKFMEKYMCWYAHEEPYVPHDTMVKRMVGSTSRFSNTRRVVLDCSNPYKNMIMDAMRMNQDHVGQCPS